MADFVLVHGAWFGAWCWRRVLPSLWRAGHRAFAVSLTGVGERAHLLSRTITLDTHVDDVAAVIEAEELTGAVLVGHSYAGMVITAVADRLAGRIARLVYVDAVVPASGECWSSTHEEKTRAERRAAIAGGGTLLAPDPKVFGLEGADADWVRRRQTPHPGGMYDEPLAFDEACIARLPRTFVDCTAPALPTIAVMRQRVRAQPGWRIVELKTGHAPMVSAPNDLVAALFATADSA
jgi:pimeloyl-ACP methyl ester carboxylesterase